MSWLWRLLRVCCSNGDIHDWIRFGVLNGERVQTSMKITPGGTWPAELIWRSRPYRTTLTLSCCSGVENHHRFINKSKPREIPIYTDGSCLGNGSKSPHADKFSILWRFILFLPIWKLWEVMLWTPFSSSPFRPFTSFNNSAFLPCSVCLDAHKIFTQTCYDVWVVRHRYQSDAKASKILTCEGIEIYQSILQSDRNSLSVE